MRRAVPLPACLVVALAAIGCGDSYVPAPVPIAPLPLALRPGCALYAGIVNGNDKDMTARLLLCPAPGGVTGVIQFVSPGSGWSEREVSGSIGADGAMVLADTRMIQSFPSADWIYCLVDRYDLRQVPATSAGAQSVEGTYVSMQCEDRATLALTWEGGG